MLAWQRNNWNKTSRREWGSPDKLSKMKNLSSNVSAMCFAHAQFLIDNLGNYIFLKLRSASTWPGGAIVSALRYSIRKSDFNFSNDFFSTFRENDKLSHPQVQNLKTFPILCFLFHENRLRNGRAPKRWKWGVADDTFSGGLARPKMTFFALNLR